MRVLFGYNGTKAADEAIEDLKFAGLPVDAEVMVLTVAEAFSQNESVIHDAACTANAAAGKLRRYFADGLVTANASSGSPACEILEAAKSFHADLIILAEREQSLDERNIFLGTTTQKILTEAECSVRIARGHSRTSAYGRNVMIGFDGSGPSQLAVEEVARRIWPDDTEIWLGVVADSPVQNSLGRFMSHPNHEPKITQQWGEALADNARRRLNETGLSVKVAVSSGNARDALIELARQEGAASIFVGPHCQGNSFERYLIGSVSSAVAARAECSVEIVRAPGPRWQ